MAPQCRRHRLLISCFVVLALCTAPALAGRGHYRRLQPRAPAAAKGPANTTEQFLAPHNQARAAVGVGELVWSADLAAAAAGIAGGQRQQQACGFADVGASPYGANQGWASYPASPGEVVAAWVAQGRYYNHADNSCAAGQQCGTYTQVVWRRSAELGCAQATCAGGATLTVCLYNPHGNVQGQSPY